MEIITPIQPVAYVSGAHSFILHIARIAGIAPISFEKIRGGWRIRFSWFFYAYCVLVEIMLHTIISLKVYEGRDDVLDGYEPSSNTGFMRIVTIVLGTMQVIVGLSIGFTGRHRMRFVIDSMAHLEQINNELHLLFIPPNTSEIKAWLKVIILLLYGYLGSFVDYGIYLYDVIIANDGVPFQSVSMTFTYLNVVHLQLLSMQFHMVVMNLVYTQQRLKICLERILDEFRSDSCESLLACSSPKYIRYIEELRINMPSHVYYRSSNHKTSTVSVGTKTNAEVLRLLINIYCLQCDIIRKLNDGHGIPIIMMLLYCAVYMVTSPYFVVTVLIRSHSQMPIFKIVSIFGYCILCFVMIIVGTESCQRSHIELKLIKKLVNQILRYTPREDAAVYYQVKMFKYHILLNPVSFSPMFLFKFDRNLSIAVLSAVITYLTVFMNL